jgi:hypothetical protein
MKKKFVLMIVLVLLVCFSVSKLEAENKGMDFYLHAGVMTDDSFSFDPFLWTAGANMDFHLGDMFMLSPEVHIIVHKFKFDPLWLAPGCLLNVKLESFFFGGGLTKWFIIGDGYELTTDIALKLNAGFTGDNFKLTAYAVMDFDSIFKNMVVGATFAIKF